MNKEEMVQALAPLGCEGLGELKNSDLIILVRMQESAVKANKALEEAETKIQALGELLAKANARLEESENKKPGSLPQYKVDAEIYELVSEGTFKGRRITDQVLRNDMALLRQLIKMKAGIIRKKG